MNIIGPILFLVFSQFAAPFADRSPVAVKPLASESISLDNRQPNKSVNDVFKDNILLNTAYLSGKVTKKADVKWDEIRKPFEYRFTLMSGEAFAFHEDVLEEYKNSLVKTTNANFNFTDGFKSDGYLMGDGVCHLASLMYWVSKTAGLNAYAPTNHNFAVIPEIDKEFGVSIYKMPGNYSANTKQNLYITNKNEYPVVFEFIYNGNLLKLSIYEEIL